MTLKTEWAQVGDYRRSSNPGRSVCAQGHRRRLVRLKNSSSSHHPLPPWRAHGSDHGDPAPCLSSQLERKRQTPVLCAKVLLERGTTPSELTKHKNGGRTERLKRV